MGYCQILICSLSIKFSFIVIENGIPFYFLSVEIQLEVHISENNTEACPELTDHLGLQQVEEEVIENVNYPIGSLMVIV